MSRSAIQSSFQVQKSPQKVSFERSIEESRLTPFSKPLKSRKTLFLIQSNIVFDFLHRLFETSPSHDQMKKLTKARQN
jgi:hypothetical protein